MTTPNFLIIGAARSGTTSLYNYLGQHPHVYTCPVKEPDFFSYEGVELDFDGPDGKEQTNRGIRRHTPANIEEYHSLFRGASNEKATGEASPMYLYSARAPSRIKDHVPAAKLIAILRNPVERAYSAFSLLSLQGREPLGEFSQALRAEEVRIRNKWTWMYHYKNVGFYHVQLKRYFDIFERDQIKVYLYEDLEDDPLRLAQDVFQFLEVDDAFVPEVSLIHNPSGTPRNEAFSRLVDKPNPLKAVVRFLFPYRIRKRIIASLKNRNLAERAPLTPEIREELLDAYREDISELENLIGRDLSGWLE
jgi:sulfotransferase family protein